MVVNVENDAVPNIGEVGPAVDSGYVDSDLSDISVQRHSTLRGQLVYSEDGRVSQIRTRV